MFINVQDLHSISTSGENYDSIVVDQTALERKTDDDGRVYYTSSPIVEFTTVNGTVIKDTLDFSTSNVENGETYRVNYNVETGKIITLGFNLYMRLGAGILFFVVLSLLSFGMIFYALGMKMTSFSDLAGKIAFRFVLPFIMLGFTALLIYAFFDNDDMPMWVAGMLIFFITVMVFATYAIIKGIFSRIGNKMLQTEPSMRFETHEAIFALEKELGLQYQGEQDWSYSIADPKDIKKYLELYDKLYDDDVKFALMQTILQATNDQDTESERNHYWDEAKYLLESDKKLHEYTIFSLCFWATEDQNEWMKITPQLRALWKKMLNINSNTL